MRTSGGVLAHVVICVGVSKAAIRGADAGHSFLCVGGCRVTKTLLSRLVCLLSWMLRLGSRSALWCCTRGPRSLPTTMKITAMRCLSLSAQGQPISRWNLMRDVKLKKGTAHLFFFPQAIMDQK